MNEEESGTNENLKVKETFIEEPSNSLTVKLLSLFLADSTRNS